MINCEITLANFEMENQWVLGDIHNAGIIVIIKYNLTRKMVPITGRANSFLEKNVFEYK